MDEDVKIYVNETVEKVEIKVSDPFPTNVLPTGTLEINDIKANTLSSSEVGGSIPAVIYTWFKGLFTALIDGSLKSYIIGVLTILKDLATRVGVLENTTLFETTLTGDTTQIDITGLSIAEGVPFKIMIKGAGYDGLSAMLRINGINTSSYHYYLSTIYSYFTVLTAITRYLNYFSFVLFGGNVIGNVTYSRDVSGTVTGGIIQQSTFGLSITSITSISIIRIGTSVFTSGTKIKLVRA